MHSIVIWVAAWAVHRFANPGDVFPQRLTVILMPLAIFLAAIVTWKFVEVPFRLLGRHLAANLASQPAGISAPAYQGSGRWRLGKIIVSAPVPLNKLSPAPSGDS
jgi:peptidoglycan/LPS O-acetylase OafA/YrhL